MFFGLNLFVGGSGGSGSAAAAVTRLSQNSMTFLFLSDQPVQIIPVTTAVNVNTL
jgi:hypothetical protein